MVSRRAQRRQRKERELMAEAIRGTLADRYDPETVERMMRTQIEPQLLAQTMDGVDVAMVHVGDGDDDYTFEVTCVGCGRTARLPFQPPEGKVVLCPTCQRDRL